MSANHVLCTMQRQRWTDSVLDCIGLNMELKHAIKIKQILVLDLSLGAYNLKDMPVAKINML